MKTNDSPPNAPNFKVQPRSEKIAEWLQSTEQAMHVLIRWANCLTAWEHETPSDDDFMAAIQEMSELGLLEWLDGNPLSLDDLRDLVTDAVYPPPKLRSDETDSHLKSQKFNTVDCYPCRDTLICANCHGKGIDPDFPFEECYLCEGDGICTVCKERGA